MAWWRWRLCACPIARRAVLQVARRGGWHCAAASWCTLSESLHPIPTSFSFYVFQFPRLSEACSGSRPNSVTMTLSCCAAGGLMALVALHLGACMLSDSLHLCPTPFGSVLSFRRVEGLYNIQNWRLVLRSGLQGTTTGRCTTCLLPDLSVHELLRGWAANWGDEWGTFHLSRVV